ncbi:MAG: flippase-like domain-containing protein [Actinobacteria bacterium]|nr:flippase-like domain-containing protein [Actinomycetota bacterium]
MTEPDFRKVTSGRILRATFVAVSLGIIVHVLLLARPGLTRAAVALRNMQPVLIAVAVLLELASSAALVQLYRSTLSATGTALSFRQVVPVSMAGFTVSRLFPGGGLTAAVFMTREFAARGINAATSTGSVVVAGTLGMLVLGEIVALGTIASLLRGDLPPAYAIAIPLVAVLLAIACAIGFRLLTSPQPLATALNHFESFLSRFRVRALLKLRSFVGALRVNLSTPAMLRTPALWSLANWLTDIAALWVLFFGFGYHLHLGIVVVGYGVANLLTALPVTPGGLGLVEAGLAGTYVAFGVPSEIAIVVVLAYRLISYWLPSLAGLPVYFHAIQKMHDDLNSKVAGNALDGPLIKGERS